LRDGHIYNVQGKAMPCPVFFIARRGGCSRPLPLRRSPSWFSRLLRKPFSTVNCQLSIDKELIAHKNYQWKKHFNKYNRYLSLQCKQGRTGSNDLIRSPRITQKTEILKYQITKLNNKKL
ncbi:MAG: hypothetical protein LBH72_05140, partial [Proteiniphilum sp.]|nr:hypothetical protein [Proteiniphilum sp.]